MLMSLAALQDTPCTPPPSAVRFRSRPAEAEVSSIEPSAVAATSRLDSTLPRAMSPPAARLMPPVLAVTLLPEMSPPAPITI
ncbi:hypothetical protein D9M68_984730 [compost metagenome]